MEEHELMKALVIETAFLGDVIIALGVARELKRIIPDCHVSYLVRPDAAGVAAGCPDVDEVLTYDKHGSEGGLEGIRQKAEELSGQKYDVVVLLHGSRRSQELCRLIEAPVKAGFANSGSAGLTHKAEERGLTSRYQRALLPLMSVYSNVDLHALPRLSTRPLQAVEEFAGRFASVIALAPGSVWATKRWGWERFRELALELTRKGNGVMILGASSERETNWRIANGVSADGILDLTGRIPIEEAASALTHAKALVANDSAPVHLATAVGTPVVAIYGPTVPEFGFAPASPCSAVVQKDMWCRPCTSHGSGECPIYTHACMREISVADVMSSLESVLLCSSRNVFS